VDRSGDQLLAGPRFAKDQDRAFGAGDLLNRQADRLHGPALAGEQAEVALGLGLITEVSRLSLKPFQICHARCQLDYALVPFPAALAHWFGHADMLAVHEARWHGLRRRRQSRYGPGQLPVQTCNPISRARGEDAPREYALACTKKSADAL